MLTPEEEEKFRAILSEYDGATDRFNRSQWSNKFGERFKPYEDKLKKLNGDDFDIMKESYDEYHKDYSDLSDDDYANSLEENIKKVLQRIWPEAEPEQIKQAAEEAAESAAENGEAKVEVETKPETEVKVDNEKIEEPGAKAEAEKPEKESEESEENDDSTEDFVKELEDYKAKMPKRG